MPDATTLECDCLVVGGGPAGCGVAAWLAQRGRSVIVVDDGRKKHAFPEETLVPTARGVIERLDLTQVFANLDAFGMPRQGVQWAATEPTWRELTDAERGFQVPRGAFDAALRQHVAAMPGVTLLGAHRVRTALPIDIDTSPSPVAIQATAAGGREYTVRPRVLVVSAGRGHHRALLGPHVHRVAAGSATTALAFHSPTRQRLGDATLVEAVATGWLWWIPQRGGGACVAAFCDTAELQERGHAAVVADALADCGDRAGGLDLTAPAHGADATPRLQTADAQVLLCGDAASCVDPLSSQGVEKALASAEHAALAAHTILSQPSLGALVRAHHAAWEQQLWNAHDREARGWYARETRFVTAPFWRIRGSSAPRAALDEHDHLSLATGTQTATALERHQDRLVTTEGVIWTGAVAAIASVGRIPVASLTSIVGKGVTLSAALRAARTDPVLFPLPPRAVVAALEHLVDIGLVERRAR